jgi:hypothetical protein
MNLPVRRRQAVVDIAPQQYVRLGRQGDAASQDVILSGEG